MWLYSAQFFLGFLPITLFLYWMARWRGLWRASLLVLIGASVIFAAIHSLGSVGLILCSVLVNYAFGFALAPGTTRSASHRKIRLALAVTSNLVVLAYFKYFSSLIESADVVLGPSYQSTYPLFMPLGISFLTFQQIAYLVDVYRGQINVHQNTFGSYILFCSFFPKQVAGPILRYAEVVGELKKVLGPAALSGNVVEGLTVFTIGLCKKVVLADSLASYSNSVFGAVPAAQPMGFVEAWGGLLAYTFQLYFDFSGYTDMAIGVALLFGIRLPENFDAPYSATSMIDFWKRWHMTLSRFLRDYLYIPLGGNRLGFGRQLVNVFVTMVLCGIWHGAGLTFVIWGALHGAYLCLNHAWKQFHMPCPEWVGWMLTFLAVTYSWVWFRAESVSSALNLTASLTGLHGLWAEGWFTALRTFQTPADSHQALASILHEFHLTVTYHQWTLRFEDIVLSAPFLQLSWIAVAAVVVFLLPKTREWAVESSRTASPAYFGGSAVAMGLLIFLALAFSMSDSTPLFVYSRF
jgi:alginate O-acetyltransferase complex protein AlgI